jgi:hypothetical protein
MIRAVIEQHIAEIGGNFVHPGASVAVAGVDTLIRRTNDPFLTRVQVWQTDEAHHLLEDNKWGRALQAVPNAKRGVGWTATPCRTDKKALRRGQGGVFDTLVVGPTMRDLIDQGHLADFRIWSLPQSINTTKITVKGGDFDGAALRNAAHQSSITGDVVAHFMRVAADKCGVTFAVDVSMAEEHAAAFRAAGVPAGTLHAKTPLRERIDMIKAFRRRELRQIVNVDVLGEGFDCPGIEVVSFARPTMSYGLYVQQFGRGLRPLAGKTEALILDHVGNVVRHHGPPDRGRPWSLDAPPKQAPVEVSIQVCGNPECMSPFEAGTRTCPYCEWTAPVTARVERARPAQVEGDLTLYSPDQLNELRREVDRIAGPPRLVPTLPDHVRDAAVRTWEVRREAQASLSTAIDAWAGRWHHAAGEAIQDVYKRFYRTFGVDTLTALTLSGSKQQALTRKVEIDGPQTASAVGSSRTEHHPHRGCQDRTDALA